MSKEVSGTIKDKDIFNIVDEFFKKNDLEWSKLVACTTKGAPAMLGRKSGLRKSCFTRDHFYSLFHSQIRTLCQGVAS